MVQVLGVAGQLAQPLAQKPPNCTFGQFAKPPQLCLHEVTHTPVAMQPKVLLQPVEQLPTQVPVEGQPPGLLGQLPLQTATQAPVPTQRKKPCAQTQAPPVHTWLAPQAAFAPHLQTPAAQVSAVAPHAVQAAPAVPHAAVALGWQFLLASQHPVGQLCGVQAQALF